MDTKKYDITFGETISSSIEDGYYIVPQKDIGNNPSANHQTHFNVSTRNTPEENFHNWESVYNHRENFGDSPFLAAQEKYLFARLDVSEGGGVAFVGEIIWQPLYQGAKIFFPSNMLEQGNNPVSPPSLDQLSQGIQGAIDGLKDWIHKKYKEGKTHNTNENPYIKEFNDQKEKPQPSSQSYDYKDVPVINDGGGGGGGGKFGQKPTAIV